jgi:hypothetical protein
VKLSNISRGDLYIETDRGMVRMLCEALFPMENQDLAEYVVYRNSIRLDNNSKTIDIEFEPQILQFLEGEFLTRNMRIIVE